MVASPVEPEQTERQESESAVEGQAEPELKSEQITSVSGLEETGTQAEPANEALVDEQPDVTPDFPQEGAQTTTHEQDRAVEPPPEENVPVSEIDIEAEPLAEEPLTNETRKQKNQRRQLRRK